MKKRPKICINYRYQNWGTTEKIMCEQDEFDDLMFFLIKDGQNVGTLVKKENHWEWGINTIFDSEEILKIGRFIDRYLYQKGKNCRSYAPSSHDTAM